MIVMKVFVFLIALVTATTVSAAPPDPLTWMWQNAWPKQKPQQRAPVFVPMPAAKPKPARSTDHRKTHKTAPKIAKRESWPLQKMKKPAPIVQPEKRARDAVKKQRAAVRQQRKPTASECAQMRSAGRSLVVAGARIRGYPDHVVDRALRDCGL